MVRMQTFNRLSFFRVPRLRFGLVCAGRLRFGLVSAARLRFGLVSAARLRFGLVFCRSIALRLGVCPSGRSAADGVRTSDAPADDAARMEFFEKKVRPVLVNNCYNCHSANTNSKGGLRVDDRNGLLTGGRRGPAVVPGEPEKSLLDPGGPAHARQGQNAAGEASCRSGNRRPDEMDQGRRRLAAGRRARLGPQAQRQV